MSTWRLIYTSPAYGAWNMAADEAILEHIHRGDSPTTLRLYSWDPACLSLGHAQSFKDVDMERIKSHGWEVVRRATGGRAILHTDELTYSITGPAEEPALIGSVLESYNRLAQALLYAVHSLGLPVEIKEEAQVSNGQNLNPICFEVPSSYEITVQGKKLIGSAQARKKEGVLQHGSLPLIGDLTRICQALIFQSEDAREKAGARLLEHATTVENVLGRRVSFEEAGQAFVKGFEAQLGIQFERGEMSPSEIKRTEELVTEKYAHASWTERS
jgi:lipoyl(octanoyl) transferase